MPGEQPLSIERAEAIVEEHRERCGDLDHSTLDAIADLGRECQRAGDLSRAESLFSEVLAGRRRNLDADDPAVIRAEFQLAGAIMRRGEMAAARTLWEEVLEASDRVFGSESDYSLRAAINLAICLRKLGRYGDELPLRQRALDLTRRLKGSEDIDSYHALVDLADVLDRLGNRESALDLNKEALKGLQRSGADARILVSQKWKMAEELAQLGRGREASEMFDEVRDYVDHLDPDDPWRKPARRARRFYSLLGRSARRQMPAP